MTSGQIQVVIIILTTLGVLIIPLLALLTRIVVKWTRVESKLDSLAQDMKDIIVEKDKVHSELVQQMTADRAATDKRLRWLEENIWNRGRRPV